MVDITSVTPLKKTDFSSHSSYYLQIASYLWVGLWTPPAPHTLGAVVLYGLSFFQVLCMMSWSMRVCVCVCVFALLGLENAISLKFDFEI